MRLVVLLTCILAYLAVAAHGAPALLNIGGLLDSVAGVFRDSRPQTSSTRTDKIAQSAPVSTADADADADADAQDARKSPQTSTVDHMDDKSKDDVGAHDEQHMDVSGADAAPPSPKEGAMRESLSQKPNLFENTLGPTSQRHFSSSGHTTTVVENEDRGEDERAEMAPSSAVSSSGEVETVMQTQFIVLAPGEEEEPTTLSPLASYEPLENMGQNVGVSRTLVAGILLLPLLA
ncbi:hypothetical protein GQ54DRAFT_160707 [Martensiomyces pterosporus]|nr:hypothetical protein GQ54DRAFT_160707 [Martensiomyces pterosporus]